LGNELRNFKFFEVLNNLRKMTSARLCDGSAPCGPNGAPCHPHVKDVHTKVEEYKVPFWRAWNIAPHLSQQAAQYNLSSSAIAVFIMDLDIYSPEPAWAKDFSNAVGFIGAATGMLIMGVAGDLFGRRKALLFTLVVCALGVFIAGFAAGTITSAYIVVIVGKFISGVGAGGLYPLGGCLAVEAAKGTGARKVDTSAWVLSNQIPGKTWPYIVALIFSPASDQVSFRAIFFGGILLCFLCGFLSPRTRELSFMAQGHIHKGHVDSAFQHDIWACKWLRALVGTAGTWFLFDVANYGIELATPDLVDDVFGASDSIPEKAGESLAVLYSAIFGAAFSIIWIRQRWSIKWLEIVGFLLSMLMCIIMALSYHFKWSPGIQFMLLCFIQVTLMIPNITTYVVPLLTYPTLIRCSYHGWSAFSGKLGAALGAYVVPFVQRSAWGFEGVFWIMAAVCGVGAVFCFFFLKDPPSWEDFLASDPGSGLPSVDRVSMATNESAQTIPTLIGSTVTETDDGDCRDQIEQVVTTPKVAAEIINTVTLARV